MCGEVAGVGRKGFKDFCGGVHVVESFSALAEGSEGCCFCRESGSAISPYKWGVSKRLGHAGEPHFCFVVVAHGELGLAFGSPIDSLGGKLVEGNQEGPGIGFEVEAFLERGFRFDDPVFALVFELAGLEGAGDGLIELAEAEVVFRIFGGFSRQHFEVVDDGRENFSAFRGNLEGELRADLAVVEPGACAASGIALEFADGGEAFLVSREGFAPIAQGWCAEVARDVADAEVAERDFNSEGFIGAGFDGQSVEISKGFCGHAGTEASCALYILKLVVEVEDLIMGEAADVFKASLGEAFFFEGGIEAGGGGDQHKGGGSDVRPIAAQEFGGAVGGAGGAG